MAAPGRPCGAGNTGGGERQRGGARAAAPRPMLLPELDPCSSLALSYGSPQGEAVQQRSQTCWAGVHAGRGAPLCGGDAGGRRHGVGMPGSPCRRHKLCLTLSLMLSSHQHQVCKRTLSCWVALAPEQGGRRRSAPSLACSACEPGCSAAAPLALPRCSLFIVLYKARSTRFQMARMPRTCLPSLRRHGRRRSRSSRQRSSTGGVARSRAAHHWHPALVH